MQGHKLERVTSVTTAPRAGGGLVLIARGISNLGIELKATHEMPGQTRLSDAEAQQIATEALQRVLEQAPF